MRPITCLPNLYKLISKLVTSLLSELCEVNETISENQLGIRKKCQGAKQQALLNKNLNRSYNNSLYTSWIDIQKAYDSINHKYLIEVLEKLNIPRNLLSFITRTLNNKKTNLVCNKKKLDRSKLERVY